MDFATDRSFSCTALSIANASLLDEGTGADLGYPAGGTQRASLNGAQLVFPATCQPPVAPQITSIVLNEDGSITAEGYFVVDGNVNYTIKNLTFSIIGENLLDTEWNEAQFATESRLKGEDESVEELHFTPGVPFFLRGKVAYRF